MIVVLPFHAGDSNLVADLLDWCADLGNCKNHTALLVADAAVPWDTGRKLLSQAQQVFASASILCTEKPHSEKWPAAANAMWLASARHIAAHVKAPWLHIVWRGQSKTWDILWRNDDGNTDNDSPAYAENLDWRGLCNVANRINKDLKA